MVLDMFARKNDDDVFDPKVVISDPNLLHESNKTKRRNQMESRRNQMESNKTETRNQMESITLTQMESNTCQPVLTKNVKTLTGNNFAKIMLLSKVPKLVDMSP